MQPDDSVKSTLAYSIVMYMFPSPFIIINGV